MHTLTTARLTLRQWREADLAPFAAMHADPVTMQFLPRCPSRAESDEFARRLQGELAARGWGLWAVERRARGEFLGFVGLAAPAFEAHFTPCTEIAWRLGREHRGCGYATEAAREGLRFALATLALPEVVSSPAARAPTAVARALPHRARAPAARGALRFFPTRPLASPGALLHHAHRRNRPRRARCCP